MNYRDGRGKVILHPVVITDEIAGKFYFHSDRAFFYNLLFNNCKHYSLKGLKKAGGDVKKGGPIPKTFSKKNSKPVHSWGLGDEKSYGTKPNYK